MRISDCEDVLSRVEPLAEGEPADEAVRAHLRACARCAAALARARQVGEALEALPTLSASAAFTTDVVRLTRSLRWQSEQRFDRWFNAATVAALIVIALGVWGLMNVTGLTAVTVGTADFVGRSLPVLYDQVKPQISRYGLAGMLVAGGLAIWWLLERNARPQRTA